MKTIIKKQVINARVYPSFLNPLGSYNNYTELLRLRPARFLTEMCGLFFALNGRIFSEIGSFFTTICIVQKTHMAYRKKYKAHILK